jgi:peptide/nickel transport system permease protein
VTDATTGPGVGTVVPARRTSLLWRGRTLPAPGAIPGGDLRRALTPVALVSLFFLIVPVFAPYSAMDITSVGALHAPSIHALFGTDEVGRDVFSRVLYGLRTSWFAALGVIIVGASFGGLVGALAGAFGGWIDTVLMRITDLFLALPAAVLAIAVVAAMGPSLLHTLLALVIVWWPWYARIVRGEVRALASRPHAEAARLAGVSRRRLVMRHLLPGAIPPVVVTMSLDVGNLVLVLATLSFIGLGAPAPSPELGAMSARGLEYLFGHPWVPVAPAIAVALLALVANLLGDHVNRRLDQRNTR